MEGAVFALTVGFQGLPCGKYWDFVRGGKGRAGLQGVIPFLGLGREKPWCGGPCRV